MAEIMANRPDEEREDPAASATQSMLALIEAKRRKVWNTAWGASMQNARQKHILDERRSKAKHQISIVNERVTMFNKK
jgi:hypothetical protein